MLAFAPAAAQYGGWESHYDRQHDWLDQRHDDVHDQLDEEHAEAHEQLQEQRNSADYQIARQHQREHRRDAWQRRYGNYGYYSRYGY